MALKDMLKEDIGDIFLDCNDFAVERIVEGRTINVVEDNDKLAELKAGVENNLVEAELFFMANIDDLPARRGYGAVLNYDGTDYLVVSWSENCGMAEIALKQNGGAYGDYA